MAQQWIKTSSFLYIGIAIVLVDSKENQIVDFYMIYNSILRTERFSK